MEDFRLKQSLIGVRQLLRVNNGAVELDASIMGGQQDGKKMKVPLNSRYIYSKPSLYTKGWSICQ